MTSWKKLPTAGHFPLFVRKDKEGRITAIKVLIKEEQKAVGA